MEYLKFSNWIKKHYDLILWITFFIKWGISTIFWVSNYSNFYLLTIDLTIFSITYYSSLIIFNVLALRWICFTIPRTLLKNKQRKGKKIEDEKKLNEYFSADSRNFNLLFTILLIALGFVKNLFEFALPSFFLILYLSTILFIIPMFIFYIIFDRSRKKLIVLIISISVLILVYILTCFIDSWIETTFWFIHTPIELLILCLLFLLPVIKYLEGKSEEKKEVKKDLDR